MPLGGWAVGAQPHFFPEGLALRVPKGSDLVIQYHFHPTGKPEAEKSLIGLYFAKQAAGAEDVAIQLPPVYSLFAGLDIPAGDKDYMVHDSYTLPVDMDAVGVGAHAHYLGKQLKMTATLPDGEIKTLLLIKRLGFRVAGPIFLQRLRGAAQRHAARCRSPLGQLRREPAQPFEPAGSPSTWGEQSKDEMGSVSLIAVPRIESDYPHAAGEHRAHRVTEAARERIKQDPSFMQKLRELIGQ